MTSGTAGDDTEDGKEAGYGEDHDDRCHCHGRQRRTVYSILCRHSRRPCMRPSTSSSLRITDRSFQYASPRLWNQLPASLRQPCTNLYTSDSLSSFSGTSSIGSIDSPLSSSITPSLFHSRLKTFLFCKSFPSQPSFSSSKLTPRIPPLFTDTSEHRPIRFFRFLVFLLSTF